MASVLSRRQLLHVAVCSAPAGLLAGCGFHLRGALKFPFASVYVQGPQTSELIRMLRRALASQVRVADRPDQAEAVLQILSERQEQVSVVYSTSAQVREVELVLTVEFALLDRSGGIMIDRTPLRLLRDVSYNESQALSKQAEFETLYRDMRQDATLQIMRRMAAAHPPARI